MQPDRSRCGAENIFLSSACVRPVPQQRFCFKILEAAQLEKRQCVSVKIYNRHNPNIPSHTHARRWDGSRSTWRTHQISSYQCRQLHGRNQQYLQQNSFFWIIYTNALYFLSKELLSYSQGYLYYCDYYLSFAYFNLKLYIYSNTISPVLKQRCFIFSNPSYKFNYAVCSHHKWS